jgi:hypothetical protein
VGWSKRFGESTEQIVIREGVDAWLFELDGAATPTPGGFSGNVYQLPPRFVVPLYPTARVWPVSPVGTPFVPPFAPARDTTWDYVVPVPVLIATLTAWSVMNNVANLFWNSERSLYVPG